MKKDIHYADDARKELLKWVETVANVVKVTMWPKGRNVILDKWFGAPTVTNDGVSVAKEIELEDKVENVWAEMVKEAAEKTNKEAWDGTTSTVVLAHAIAKEGLRYIRSWVNPFSLWKGLHKAVAKLVEEIEKKAQQIGDSKEKIRQVATISAQDEEVWNLIADVFEEIGKDWTITVEEGKSLGLTKEIKTGMQFDQGYSSPYLVTDTQRMEAVIEKPYILLTDKKIEKCTAKFRYRGQDNEVTLEYLNDGNIIVHYPQGVKSVTPGQACVLYNGEECIGSGIIKEVYKNGSKLWYLP